jgi:ABC-2 type transport system permease protein
MKHFKGFVIKEFYHIFRDKRTLAILFIMPVIQMLLFGYVVTNEIKDAKIAVLDRSQDMVTRKITDKLGSSGYFIITKVLTNENQIGESFRNGSVKEVVVFEPGFAEKLQRENKASVHLIADASDANTANLIVNYTSAIINDYMAKENATVKVPMQIVTETRMLYNEELKGVYMFVPGTMTLILVLICAMLTSVSIVREKELGTMEILLVSPLKPLQIIIGKVIPYAALSFVNVITILLLSNFVFGLPIQGSIIFLLCESMLFIMLSLSLGIFISTSTNSQQTAMMMSLMGLMLPTIILSGFIYPVENMPWILQWICHINPSTYFIIIIKNIMLKGLGFMSVWKETAVLCGMIVFFITMSVRKFKIRLE